MELLQVRIKPEVKAAFTKMVEVSGGSKRGTLEIMIRKQIADCAKENIDKRACFLQEVENAEIFIRDFQEMFDSEQDPIKKAIHAKALKAGAENLARWKACLETSERNAREYAECLAMPESRIKELGERVYE